MLEDRRDRRLSVEKHRINAVVRALRHLRVELVVAGFAHVEGNRQLRARPFALEDHDVLRPEEVANDRGLSLLGDDRVHHALDLELLCVALRQPRGPVGYRRQPRRDPVLVPESDRGHQVVAHAEGGLDRSILVERPAEVLDVEAKRLGKGDRVEHVPAVAGHPRPEPRAVGDGHARI